MTQSLEVEAIDQLVYCLEGDGNMVKLALWICRYPSICCSDFIKSICVSVECCSAHEEQDSVPNGLYYNLMKTIKLTQSDSI